MDKMNNEKLIKNEVLPLIKQAKEILIRNNVPFFFTALSSDDGKDTKYDTEWFSPSVAGLNVSDDRISRLIVIMSGFEAVPPEPTFDLNLNI